MRWMRCCRLQQTAGDLSRRCSALITFYIHVDSLSRRNGVCDVFRNQGEIIGVVK